MFHLGVKFSRFSENRSIRTAGARAEVWSKFRPNFVWSPGRPIEVCGAHRSKFGGGFRTNCYCVWLYPKPLMLYRVNENEIIPKTHTKTNSSPDIGDTGIEENLIVSWFCDSTSQKKQSKFAPSRNFDPDRL